MLTGKMFIGKFGTRQLDIKPSPSMLWFVLFYQIHNTDTSLRLTSLRLVFCMAVASLIIGCDVREPRWRTYEEKNTSSGHQHTASSMPATRPMTSRENLSLQWTKPDGWSEKAGSGMRLATLTTSRGDQVATCTLITLGGTAGGLEANVRRWFGQLKLDVPNGDEFTAFLERQERIQSEGDFEGVLVNLTEFGPASDGSSMLAALFSVNSTTLFIKMTGPLELLVAEKDHFAQFCKSLRPGE